MMVCATSSTIRNPAPPRPLLLSMAITAASRPARRRSAPTSVVALDRQKARLGYAGNTHRQPTQPDRGPARRLIWPAKPGQLQSVNNIGHTWRSEERLDECPIVLDGLQVGFDAVLQRLPSAEWRLGCAGAFDVIPHQLIRV